MPSEEHIVHVHGMLHAITISQRSKIAGLPLANTRTHTLRPWDQAPPGPPDALPLAGLAASKTQGQANSASQMRLYLLIRALSFPNGPS
jgi:hypothetical protein